VVAPQVASCAPADGSVGVKVDASIQIGFDKPMDRASTEAAFSLSCQSIPVQGAIRWSDGDKLLVFTPKAPLQYSTGFQIGIGLQAKDLLGGSLANTFASSFTTAEDLSAPIIPSQPETPPTTTKGSNETVSESQPSSGGRSAASFYLTYLGYLPGGGGVLAYSQAVGALLLYSLFCGVDLVLYHRSRQRDRRGRNVDRGPP
jgi:hypothetical protein